MMKQIQYRRHTPIFVIILITLLAWGTAPEARGQVTFTGSGGEGNNFGEPISGSTMTWTDDGTTVTVNFSKGLGEFNDRFVIYLSTGAAGRSSIDTEVNDRQDALRSAISYMEAGTGHSLNFPTEFEATHAIGIEVGFGGLWQIPATGFIGNDGLSFVTAVNSTLDGNDQENFTFEFDWADIGLAEENSRNIQFVATYLNPFGGEGDLGFASNEGYGVEFPVDNIGQASFTFTSAESYHAAYLTGQPGFRMMSAPTAASFSDLLGPIWTQGFDGADTPAGDPNVWLWNNASTDNDPTNWLPLSDITDQVTAGTGFLVYVYEDDDPNEEGITGGFPKTLSLSGTENAANVTPDINNNPDNWTLLGNPFAAPISFDALDKENIFEVVYVWDPSGEEYSSWTVGETGAGDLTDGIIAPFQGFFVETEATSPSVTFTNDAKTAGGVGFLGKTAPSSLVRMEMQGEGMSNSTWLSFREDGSMDRHPGDAHQLMPLSTDYVILASQKTDGLFDISLLPIPDEDFELPLVTRATKGGTYTLSVTDWNVSLGQSLFLVDRKLDTSVELREDMTYEFELDQPLEKSVNSPFELISHGPKKAVASDEPRFAITASGPVSSETPSDLPDRLELAQNYPNPFNPATRISYTVPEQTEVRLAVYDMLGRQIAVLVDETKSPGSYNVTWDASTLSSGVYLYRLDAGGQTLTRSMTLVK